MLREKIGHDNFRRGIQAYYKKYFNANTTTSNFITEMEDASGQDLKDFFNQYLLRADNLQLKGSWNYDNATNRFILKLQQTQSSGIPFSFPIEIALYKTGIALPEIVKLNMSSLNETFNLPSNSKPDLIVVDPRVVLLHEFEWK